MSFKALSIRLNQRQTTWHPGQTVTGNVRLEATEQVNADSIDVVFEGRSKSKASRRRGNTTTTYRGLAILFRLSQVLFKGPFTLKPGVMEWPFEFRFPEFSRWSGNFNYKGSVNTGIFNGQPGQPLPPTMSSRVMNPFGDNMSCYISYRLTATLHVSGTFRSNREFPLELQVRPYRAVAAPELVYQRTLHRCNIRTLHLDPSISERSLNFKERVKTAFQPSKLPISVFSIKVDLPQSAISYQPMKIELFLEHNLQQSTAPELPVVYIKKVSLSLKERVYTMVKAFHLIGEDDDRDSWTNKKNFWSWDGSAPLTERMDLSSIMPRQICAPYFSPSFGTYNIAIDYSFTAEFTLECAQQKEMFKATVPTFVLHAAEYRGSAAETTAVEAAPLGPPEEEQLPAYSAKEEAAPPAAK